jgi:benzoyl-CoA reductase/2-hydroxyglutaryl-CoA dehydratase subunit BcrC/BadD/HgdB
VHEAKTQLTVKGGMETVLGWVCAYTPEEVFAALGIRSVRLYGGESQTSAMRYLPANLCPLVRACLSEGLDNAGTDASLSGVVLTASCHAMVHLANAFQQARGANGQFFVHLLDLPRTFGRDDQAACRAFAADLRGLAGRLGEFYGVAWSDEAFLTAIYRQQQVRLLLRELYRMRRERPERFRSAGLLELARAAGRTRKEELVPVLSRLVASLQDAGSNQGPDAGSLVSDFPPEAGGRLVSDCRPEASTDPIHSLIDQSDPPGWRLAGAHPETEDRIGGRQDGGSAAVFLEQLRRQGSPLGPRLLVTGNSLPPAYLDLIEDLGGNVAGDDLCQGYRYCLPDTEPGSSSNENDLFMVLARSYLQRPPCPRMLAGTERFAYLQALIRECRAQGVIYHTLKFCDAAIYDYALLRSRFMDAGIPVLYLETEYRDTGLEQASTRIQAFLEVLGPPTVQQVLGFSEGLPSPR